MRLPVLQLSCTPIFFYKQNTSPRSVSPPTAKIWLPATSGFSQSQNRRCKAGDLWMRPSHSTQAQSTASHCRLTSPPESECWRIHSKVSSSCKVTLRPRDLFSRYSKWLDTFRTVLVYDLRLLRQATDNGMSGFCRGALEIFALPGWSAAYVDHRRFKTAYRSHLQGSWSKTLEDGPYTSSGNVDNRTTRAGQQPGTAQLSSSCKLCSSSGEASCKPFLVCALTGRQWSHRHIHTPTDTASTGSNALIPEQCRDCVGNADNEQLFNRRSPVRTRLSLCVPPLKTEIS